MSANVSMSNSDFREIAMPEKTKGLMDSKMINPFLKATLEILKEAASIDFNVGEFYLKKDEYGRGDVTGIIGLTGSGRGTVAVTFDENMILTIVSAILGEEMNDINDLVIDAAGELTNMITGRVVDKLAQSGFNLLLSVPTVVHGRNHRVVHHTKGPRIAIPFHSPQGQFVVEFSFDKTPEFGEKSAAVNAPSEAGEASGKAPADWGVPMESSASTGKVPTNWGRPENDG